MSEPISMDKPCLWAVIPAAGIGARTGADIPKQYIKIAGKTIVEHSIDRLSQVDGLSGIMVVLHADDQIWPTLNLSCKVPIETVIGGKERMHSVLQALQTLLEKPSSKNIKVLVHDAARPCVRVEDINALVKAVAQQDCGGILAIPLADTLKRATATALPSIAVTVPRENLWRAQTPQYFPLLSLHHALQKMLEQGLLVTDEAQAMERLGYQPLLVTGQADNIKITQAQDIELAEQTMRNQQRSLL